MQKEETAPRIPRWIKDVTIDVLIAEASGIVLGAAAAVWDHHYGQNSFELTSENNLPILANALVPVLTLCHRVGQGHYDLDHAEAKGCCGTIGLFLTYATASTICYKSSYILARAALRLVA